MAAMLHSGHNEVEGVAVEVSRKRVRHVNIRIGADGVVKLSVPVWGATLAQGEAFLRQKWPWVVKSRARILARPSAASRPPVTADELKALHALLAELNADWAARLGVTAFTWHTRAMKSMWGCCHWRTRRISYNAELARVPRALVEYVVVHELTHFDAHDHGPGFRALMGARLPGWVDLRRQLNATFR